MKDLITPILEMKSKSIKRMPCYVNRASSLGYAVPILDGCVRRGMYERTHWEQKELHDVNVQLIFDEGNQQEKSVLRDLAEAEINIIEQQTAFEWKEYQISGHVDGKYVEEGIAYPIEIKSMHPAIFDSVYVLEDFKKKPWTKAYLAQITIYMLLQGIDKGIFILKNKSNGALKQITVDLDYNLGEACLRTAEIINYAVKTNTFPDRITNRETCKECPFKLVCLPEINFGVPLKLKDDPEYEKKIDRYLSIKESAKEADALWELIRGEAKAQAENGELNIIIGKYNITGKTSVKWSFTTKVEAI